MSIKFKIPLLMVVVFIANILLLLLCYNYYIADKLTQNMRGMQNEVAVYTGEVVNEISGKSFDEARTYLAGLEDEKNLVFSLINTVSGETTEISAGNPTKIGTDSVEPVTLGGTAYVLHVQKDIDFYNLRSKNIVQDVLLFECLVMFIMLLLAGVALHFRYVKPLVRLKDSMKHYDAEGPPVRFVKRKDEIGRLESSFMDLSKSLREEKQTQRRIIASISHDVKTPLTSVMGYTERLIKRDLEKQKQKQYLNTIYAQAKDIEAIVSEFDDYLGNNAEGKLDLKPYDTAFICQMLSDEYQHELSERGIQVFVENNCGPHSKINADIVKLRRLFANIIGNSIRHGNVQSLSIIITAEDAGDHVAFSVLDNGQGVPERELPFIFEPFYTSDQSRRISGLGLSICRNIMHAHGGRISAWNNKDGGLAITVSFPV